MLADSSSITKLALALEGMTIEIKKGVETAHADFKGQVETMIDEVRKPRRAVKDRPNPSGNTRAAFLRSAESETEQTSTVTFV